MHVPKKDMGTLLGLLSLGQSRSYTPKDLKDFPKTGAGTFALASNAFDDQAELNSQLNTKHQHAVAIKNHLTDAQAAAVEVKEAVKSTEAEGKAKISSPTRHLSRP